MLVQMMKRSERRSPRICIRPTASDTGFHIGSSCLCPFPSIRHKWEESAAKFHPRSASLVKLPVVRRQKTGQMSNDECLCPECGQMYLFFCTHRLWLVAIRTNDGLQPARVSKWMNINVTISSVILHYEAVVRYIKVHQTQRSDRRLRFSV